MPGFAFDIYEATIMRLVTPLLIKEWASRRRRSTYQFCPLYELINREAACA
jgi:hypothetical protein